MGAAVTAAVRRAEKRTVAREVVEAMSGERT